MRRSRSRARPASNACSRRRVLRIFRLTKACSLLAMVVIPPSLRRRLITAVIGCGAGVAMLAAYNQRLAEAAGPLLPYLDDPAVVEGRGTSGGGVFVVWFGRGIEERIWPTHEERLERTLEPLHLEAGCIPAQGAQRTWEPR